MQKRHDFVSNSSSCSFIISSELDRVPFLEKLFPRTAIQPMWDKKDCCGNDVWFRNYTALTVGGLDFWNQDGSQLLAICGGHCIRNNHLNRYFDKDGNLRTDLDFNKVCEDIRWHYDGEPNVGQRNCCRVTDKTVQFSEWLFNQIRLNSIFWKDTRYGYDCEKEFPEALQKVKDALQQGLYVYYCFASYEGDAQVGGYFYVDLDEDHPYVKDNFKVTGAVKEFISWDH